MLLLGEFISLRVLFAVALTLLTFDVMLAALVWITIRVVI